MAKMHDDDFPMRLIRGIQAGRKRTIQEWADDYKIPYNHVMVTLTRIRKRGFHYHPYRGKIWVGTKLRTGILVDINLKEKYLVSGLNTYEDNFTTPYLVNTFRMISDGLKAQPQLASELEVFVENIQLAVINSRKRYRDVMGVIKKLN